MMDLKLAWRAWKTGDRDQVFVKNVTIDNPALSNQQGELHQRQDGDRFRDAKAYDSNFVFRPVAEPS